MSAACRYAFVCIFHLLTNKEKEKKLIFLAACCDINKIIGTFTDFELFTATAAKSNFNL